MPYEHKKPDIFDNIIVETDALIMRIKMLFAEHVVRSIGITGSDVSELDISVPVEAEGLFQLIKINRIYIDDENELLCIETSESRKVLWDDLNIRSQQTVVDALHHAVKVCIALQEQSATRPLN